MVRRSGDARDEARIHRPHVVRWRTRCDDQRTGTAHGNASRVERRL